MLKTLDLPVLQVVPQLQQALVRQPNAVLAAPPGAGKTTAVPLKLLDAPWLAGRSIVLLEPRRLAARAAARRMADLLGEDVGETVGLRMRDDVRVGEATRIEVLTEGVLTRRVQSDPELHDVALVIFDEFHERSLHADLGLALCRDVQQGLRDDLRLLVMSATLDTQMLGAELDCEPIVSEGRSYPVETHYRALPAGTPFETAVAASVRRIARDERGSILVFLPGEPEIRRVYGLLRDIDAATDVLPLYGRQDAKDQDAALRPSPDGRRKIVLATAVAETSLTIDGVRVVVDSGKSRLAAFDANRGFGHLQTVRVSRAAADQRRGRAGRLEPGVCYRLWAEDAALDAAHAPEIGRSDLTPLALELARWGSADLPWLEPPHAGHLDAARALLRQLGALDGRGQLTAHGRAMAKLGIHPRLAAMMCSATQDPDRALACDIAALLEESGRGGDAVDLHQRWLDWRGGRWPAPRAQRVKRLAALWRRRLRVEAAPHEAAFPALLAAAFPDRIAQRRGGRDRYRLASGTGAVLPADSGVAGDYLVIAELDGSQQGRIRSAVPLSLEQLRACVGDRLEERQEVAWSAERGRVEAVRQTQLGALVLEASPLESPDPERCRAAWLEGVRQRGLAALAWGGVAGTSRQRLAFLAREDAAAGWPAVDEATLMAELDDWLGPFTYGKTRLNDMSSEDLEQALLHRVPDVLRGKLDALAPRHVTLPDGRRIKLDYSGEVAPVLAARLQWLFGMTKTPALLGGRCPLQVHLLSPAGRPLAVTQDLASFWANAYPEVRKQMRGRYPKHRWPEDPAVAG